MKLKHSEKRLLMKLRTLLRPDKKGNCPTVTIQRVGNEYRLGRVSNQGIIKDSTDE